MVGLWVGLVIGQFSLSLGFLSFSLGFLFFFFLFLLFFFLFYLLVQNTFVLVQNIPYFLFIFHSIFSLSSSSPLVSCLAPLFLGKDKSLEAFLGGIIVFCFLQINLDSSPLLYTLTKQTWVGIFAPLLWMFQRVSG